MYIDWHIIPFQHTFLAHYLTAKIQAGCCKHYCCVIEVTMGVREKILCVVRRENFRALLSPRHTSSLPMMFDAVHCSEEDTLTTKNIWDCRTTAGLGQCDARNEAAAIICGRLPSVITSCTFTKSHAVITALSVCLCEVCVFLCVPIKRQNLRIRHIVP